MTVIGYWLGGPEPDGALEKMGNMGNMGGMGNMSVWRPGCCIILVVLYSGAPPQAALAMERAGVGSFRIENGKWQMANGKSATGCAGVREGGASMAIDHF